MTISKLFPSGAIEVSDIIDGHLVRRVYFGYTKRQALAQFIRDIEDDKLPWERY
jgi:hypothetical protein